MLNADKIKTIDEILSLLNNLDKLIVIDGFNDLLSAKQQLVLLKTVLTIEEKMNEDTFNE